MMMKTRSFRLLTVLLAAVMFLALSLNVYAAGNPVTKDGLTAQLFTDKDAYQADETVNATVRVENNTGRRVLIVTSLNLPSSVTLVAGEEAVDVILQPGEVWATPTSFALLAQNMTAASTVSTGDNMQGGFWIVLTVLAVCGMSALFVYGKSKKTWLSMLLCLAMVGGLVTAAVPIQAEEISGSMAVSSIVQVDGTSKEVSATVTYTILDDEEEEVAAEPSATPEAAEEATAEPSVTPKVTEEPTTEPNATPEVTEEPTAEPSATPKATEVPTEVPTEEPAGEPTPTPTVAPTETPVVAVDTIYVSATAEDGKGDGTIENPFANIDEAKALVRKINEANVYPENGITVYFREGQYRIDETVMFTEADSGKDGAPVVYSAYNDEAVMFVGGIDEDLSVFTSVTDEAVLKRLAEGAAEHIKQIDLAKLGITDYGELNVYGQATAYFTEAGIEIPETQPPELFFDGEMMSISRYPNEGEEWATIKSVENTGDVIMNWTKYAHKDNFISEENRPETITCPIFIVDDTTKARMAGWSEAEEPWVYGYWEVNYSDQSMPIATFDAATGRVTTGIPSAREITAGKSFYFYNLLEELDEAGEYYIDRSSGILYFYPPKESGTVTFSLLADHMVVLTTGTHDIDFVGIEFKAGRNQAFNMTAVERINIENCDISKFADLGIHMADCKDVVITGCHLYDLGTGGIWVKYDTDSAIGIEMIEKLEPMGIVVENCEINNFSRIKAASSPAVRTAGVGMIVRNCKLYGSTGTAMMISGNDILIENNEIFDVLKTSKDMGVFYCGFTKEQMGIVIRNNYIHDISSSADTTDITVVYCDDTKDGVTVESNLIVNFAGNGVKINGGWDNTFSNNVLINTKTAADIAAIGMRGDDQYQVATSSRYELFRQVKDYDAYQNYPHWSEKVTELITNNGNNAPKNNVIKDNVIINVNQDINYSSISNWSIANINRDNIIESNQVYSLAEIGFADIENNAYAVDADGYVTVTTGDFTINPNSKIFTDLEGFKVFDFSKIGLIDESTGKTSVEKASGPLGPLEVVQEELEPELPEGTLFADDFSDSLSESGWQSVKDTNAAINSAGQLEISANTTGMYMYHTFDATSGKVAYEFDFTLAEKGSKDGYSTNILLVRSGDDSLVSTQLVFADSKVYFGAYDGKVGDDGKALYDGKGKKNVTTTECEVGKTYKIRLEVDSEADTYELFVDKTSILEGFLRKDATSIDRLMFDPTKTDDTSVVNKLLYDNLIVQKVEEKIGDQEGYFLKEEFSTSDLSNWSELTNTNCTIAVNNNQLQIDVSANGKMDYAQSFESSYAGKTVYESDFMLQRNGSTTLDASIMIITGTNEEGKAKSLLNIKACYDSENGYYVFGAYDGKADYSGQQENPTTVQCKDGVLYKVKVVVDPVTDTYDLYIDDTTDETEGYTRIIAVGRLREKASAFNGIQISPKGNGTSDITSVLYYDNIVIRKAEETVLLTDEFSGTALSSWSNLKDETTRYVRLNDAGQLELGIGNTTSQLYPQKEISEAATGKVVYEMDFSIDRNDSTTVEADIIVIGDMVASGETKTAQSLLNVKAYQNVFGAYDSGSPKTHKTETACEDGVTYKMRLVVDTITDTYDLFVGNTPIIEGRPIKSDTTSCTGVRISLKHTTTPVVGTEMAVVCCDNLKIYITE